MFTERCQTILRKLFDKRQGGLFFCRFGDDALISGSLAYLIITEAFMRTITVRWGAGVLAAAKIGIAVIFGGKFFRRDPGAFVGTIAKGLIV